MLEDYRTRLLRIQVADEKARRSALEQVPLKQRAHSVWTRELLARCLEWEGERCAFPNCDSPQKERLRDYYSPLNWHMCELHTRRLNLSLNVRKWLRRHDRKDTTTPEKRRAIRSRYLEKVKKRKAAEGG